MSLTGQEQGGPLFGIREMEIDFGPQHPATHGVLKLQLKVDGERIVVLVNFGDTPIRWPDDLTDATVMLSSDATRTTPGGALAPAEAVIVR